MTGDPEWRLRLFNYWGLERAGRLIEIPTGQQRVIAALALLGHRPRDFMAGLLWPDANEVHAAQSLRSCLWQIRRSMPGLLSELRNPLSLRFEVATDVRELYQLATDLQADVSPAIATTAIERLRSADLLPGWYDEWLLPEQERIRRFRLHTLEALSASCLRAGHNDEATEAAEVAALIDPFRESCQRLLIRGHLSAGNYAAAVQAYAKYRALLGREFGLGPSAETTALLRSQAVKDRGETESTWFI
ncbi:DNA-binding transcriptional activator of the SARP family [Paramicrobacterium humi]|uniref:DNA-binding transcriptional activator of the SARP family n=1 Tax=Paramicrobacterium humi TaxID=640635 RepID=A0A1H4QMH7_9MICO|nr:BTAD domain-containing putative transcriptional regulator [Microbacterium humi]SEC20727.1 DNA-binding transcriptional activator of the SARP family [Microbacterium humi]